MRVLLVNPWIHDFAAYDLWIKYRFIDDYPYPAWHLSGETRYRILMTSRGCPYRCTFCASDILNAQGFVQRKTESVLLELEYYYFDQQIREFIFYDNALLINNRRHLEPLLRQIIATNIRGVVSRLAAYSPIPGTPEGEEARKIIRDEFLREPMLQNHSCFALNNAQMAEQELQLIKAECNSNNRAITREKLSI